MIFNLSRWSRKSDSKAQTREIASSCLRRSRTGGMAPDRVVRQLERSYSKTQTSTQSKALIRSVREPLKYG
jgi:hypothetical protein